MRKENFRGFARSFAVRIIFVAPVLAATAASQSRSAKPSSTRSAVEKDSKVGDDLAADPELIALAWQYGSQANLKRRKQPVWRPDGTRLTDAETIALLDQIDSFQTHWHQPNELTPLVMVFQRRGTIKSGLATTLVLAGSRAQAGGSWMPFNAKSIKLRLDLLLPIED